MNKKIKQGLFPLIMMIVSFLLFVFFYLELTVWTVEPYYLEGLIFAVPCFIFGLITLLLLTGKLDTFESNVLTGISIPILAFMMLFVVMFFAFDAATATTTDVRKYHSVLRAVGYPNDLSDAFPSQIPDDASEVKLFYRPQLLQGSEDFILQFTTDSKTILEYSVQFSKQADEFKESSSSVPNYKYVSSSLDLLEEYETESDYKLYLLGAECYKPNDWNHGSFKFVAVDFIAKKIIFSLSHW